MIAVELINNDGNFSPKVDGDGRPIFKNLPEVSEYRAVFPYTMNIYHPNEACASAFTQIVMAVLFNQERKQAENAKKELERLRKWFTENLREKPLGKSSETVTQ